MYYSHQQIERKWQTFWEINQTFVIDLLKLRNKKFYVLDMFPYPSGKGLHVGHLRGYVATDVIARMKRMQNYTVFHPIGFDSFGLPAEQYALKTGKDPTSFTDYNITNFLKQLKALGFAYDYQKVLKTSDPRYFRWTQWIFQQFLRARLAFPASIAVNYCPKLTTVLANEEIIETSDHQMVSERGQYPVYRRYMQQWLLDIVKFAPGLLTNLKSLNWPDPIKHAQIKWIGAQTGWEILVSIVSQDHHPIIQLPIFTTYLNDWFASEIILIHAENQLLDAKLSVKTKTQLDILRQNLTTRPLTTQNSLVNDAQLLNSHLLVINPLTDQTVPLYFTDGIDPDLPNQNQLLNLYHHHQWQKLCYQNQILTQKAWTTLQKTSTPPKTLNNQLILKQYSKINWKPRTYYRLRNWVFSRQRFWGEPFPIFYDQNQQVQLIPETQLPLKLPPYNSIDRQQTGISPLAKVLAWKEAHYDFNVMPQWAGSCWYYLAYLLVKPNGDFWPINSLQAQTILNHWMPVDLYVGGQEHAVSHLLYARFWNHFLVKNIKIYQHLEPFQTLVNQGLILGSDQKKMSKSRGNIVDPMQYLVSHGADALRLYVQFLGPFYAKVAWSEKNLDAMRKWLARVYRLFIDHTTKWTPQNSGKLDYLTHKTIKEVTELYQTYHFNVAIAKLMSFINQCFKTPKLYRLYGQFFLQLLHPICPHLTAEIWELWKLPGTIVNATWPIHNSDFLQKKIVVFTLQIDGKTKRNFNLASQSDQTTVYNYCQTHFPNIIPTKYYKLIFIPKKIINFITKIKS